MLVNAVPVKDSAACSVPSPVPYRSKQRTLGGSDGLHVQALPRPCSRIVARNNLDSPSIVIASAVQDTPACSVPSAAPYCRKCAAVLAPMEPTQMVTMPNGFFSSLRQQPSTLRPMRPNPSRQLQWTTLRPALLSREPAAHQHAPALGRLRSR